MNSQSPKSSLKKNAFFNSLSFVFISAVNFLTLPFIVSKMNFEIFGIYILLTSLFGYFGIFDFGLGQGLIKFVSEYHAHNQTKKLTLAINSCLLFQIAVSVVLISVLYFFSENIIHLMNVSNQNFSESLHAFKISLLGLFVSLISAIFSSVLMGLQRYDLTSSVDSIMNFLLNISLVILLIFVRLSLSQAVLVSVLFTVSTFIIYIVLLIKNLPHYSFKFQFDLTIVRQFIKYSINIFLSKLSALFSNHLVRFIISYFLSPSAVTLFVVPTKLLSAVGGMLSNGANTIFPYISSLHANKSHELIRQAFLKATSLFAGISIPVLLFLTFYSEQILTFWMGESFAQKTWLMLSIMSISSLIGSTSTVPNLTIMGMGNSKLIALFSGISIFLYVLFLPLLTTKFGLTGTAVALFIASAITIIFVFKYNLKYINIPFVDYVRITYRHHVLLGLLFIGITLCLKLYFSFINIYLLLIGGVMILAYYYLIYQKVYLKINEVEEKNIITLTEA